MDCDLRPFWTPAIPDMNAEAVRQGIMELMARYETEPVHVLHVRDLSLELFDGLSSWHGLSSDDRLVLEAAASLHDIGWSVCASDGKGHHKESARLIREHQWTGVAPEEVDLIAQVARYHRKSTPSPEHQEFAALSAANQRRVCQLAACLRVGDALDRRHCQWVKRVVVRLNSEVLEILAEASCQIEEELEAAEKKGDLLEECFPAAVVYRWVSVP